MEKQRPTATELAIIAAQQRGPFDPTQPQSIPGRGDLMIEAHNAFALWEACNAFLETRESTDAPDAGRVPLDNALREIGFTGQTTAKREAQLLELLEDEGLREVLTFDQPDRTPDSIFEELQKKGIPRHQIEIVATFRKESIREVKSRAGKARQAPKKRRR